MSKQVTVSINNFGGGISDNPRRSTGTDFIISKHFDIFSDTQKLTPYRSLEADTNDGSTATGMKQYFVRDFVYSSTSAKLYGLGQTGAGLTKIVYKADATTGNWTLPASSEGNGAVKNGCLVEYKDYLWGFQGTNQIFKWGLLSGTPSITNTATGGTMSGTITSVANGIISSKLGELIMAYNNILVRINSSLTITEVASPIVPSNYKITSLCNWGNYVAIAASPIQPYNGVSKVYLWDTSNDVFQETIDWGEGELRVLETVEGYLVGITDRYLNNATGAGKGSMIIQIYSGGTPQVVKEIFTKKLTGKTIPTSKALRNNRLFWSAKIMTNDAGTEYNEGLWSFGRKNGSYPWAVTLDVIDENVDTDGIEAFGTAGNYFFITHSNDGSIDKTNDESTYAFTSIYESQIYNFGAVDVDKQLNEIKVSVEPITAGTLTVKIKVDGDTSWTTVGTMSTVGMVSDSFRNIVSTDANLPSGKEYKLRLESTGGVAVTSYDLVATPLMS